MSLPMGKVRYRKGVMRFKPGDEKFISLSNYKAPFVPVKDGYGSDGVQEMHKNGEHLRCKVCGDWFTYLGGHVGQHGLTAREYKVKYKLKFGTALVGEKVREKMVRSGLEHGPKSLSKISTEVRSKAQAAAAKANKRDPGSRKLEFQNERGLCYDQILDKIVQAADYFGRTPSQIEFVAYAGVSVPTVVHRYGSWNKALELAGLKLLHAPTKWDKGSLGAILRNFIDLHKRIPTQSDTKRGMMPSKSVYYHHFGVGSYKKVSQLLGYDI